MSNAIKDNQEKLLREVLKEVRNLRQEISFFIPSESLNEYAHPARIRSSYKKAIKRHIPRYAHYSN